MKAEYQRIDTIHLTMSVDEAEKVRTLAQDARDHKDLYWALNTVLNELAQAEKPAPMTSSSVMRSGEYRGRTLDDIADEDPQYILRMAEVLDIDPEFLDAIRPPEKSEGDLAKADTELAAAGQKYVLLDEGREDKLFRLRALRDFGNVKAGELGGLVAGEHNLSHEGDCWVYGNAQVFGNAWVFGTARIYGNAQVYGDAQVRDRSHVYGTAWVYEDARVFGNARVYGNAWVFGNARVYDNALVYCNAQAFGSANIYGDAMVCGNAKVYDNARVFGNAWVFGDAEVYGNAKVFGDAQVSGSAQVSGTEWRTR